MPDMNGLIVSFILFFTYGSWTLAISSGGRSSKNTVFVLGPVSSAADPINKRFNGPPFAFERDAAKSIEEKSKSSFNTPFHSPAKIGTVDT